MMRYLIQAILILLLAGSVGAQEFEGQKGCPTPYDTSRWYIDTVVCEWECTEGWTLHRDGWCRFNDCIAYVGTPVCDTLWLPKKQVWLTEEQEKRLMEWLRITPPQGSTTILTPEMIVETLKSRVNSRKLWINGDSAEWPDASP